MKRPDRWTAYLVRGLRPALAAFLILSAGPFSVLPAVTVQRAIAASSPAPISSTMPVTPTADVSTTVPLSPTDVPTTIPASPTAVVSPTADVPITAPVSPTAPVSSPVPAAPTVPLMVKFTSMATSADIAAAIQAAGGVEERRVQQLHTSIVDVPAATTDQALASFVQNPSVQRAEAAIVLGTATMPNDPAYVQGQQWALSKIAWDNAYGVVPVTGTATIAVLDTGVDASHPDLAGRVITGTSFVGTDPMSDPNGHGTEMAGIAAADVNNATGMAGVAYSGAGIASVQVLDSSGTGWDSDVVSGIAWAADHGANVILMSFSSPTYSPALADAVSYARSKGVVVVAATGNAGATTATYPAGLPGVIGVAATDQNDVVAAGSNTGSAAVAAPGVGIYATDPGGAYTTVSGTSAAAAEVAGLAALLVASGNTSAQTSNQILSASDPITGATFGRIDVARALGAPAAPVATATSVSATPTPASTAVYAAAGNATVSGKVTDASTGQAISGTTVTCDTSTGCNTSYTATTDATGHYSLTLNYSGNSNSISLTAAKVGYVTQTSAPFPVSNGGSVTGKDFSLGQLATSTPNVTATAQAKATATAVAQQTANAQATAAAQQTANAAATATTAAQQTATAQANATATVAAQQTATAQANGTATAVAQQTANAAATATAIARITQLTIAAANGPYGGTVDLSATLTNSGGAGVSGKTISFTLNGTSVGSGTTNSSGTATLSSVSLGSINAGSYPAGVGASFAGDSSYNSTNGSNSLTVTRVPLTVTAANQYRLYGAADPTFTASYTGFKNGETLATSGVTGAPSLTTPAMSSSPVGSYTITAGQGTLAAANYSFAFVNGTLTVSKATPTITWSNPADIVYGTALGSTQLNAIASVSGTFSYTPAAGTVLNAGSNQTLAVTFTPTDATDYTTATGSVPVTVTKAPLTVTASSPSMTYGGSVPAITAGYSGFVNGDTNSVVTGSPACSTTATSTSPAGSYTSSCAQGTLAAANYSFTFAPGAVTVGKAPLTVTANNATKVYGAANPSFTVSYSGFVNGEGASTLGGTLSFATAAGASSDVGSYAVTPGGLTSGNYAITFVAGNLNITSAPLTVTPADAGRAYGQNNPAFTATITGITNTDTITASYSTTATAASPVGPYAITATLHDPSNRLGNYAVTLNTGTLTVGKAALTVTANDTSRVYGDANPAFTGALSGVQNGDTITASYGTTATAASPVGPYTIVPTLHDPAGKLSNYTVSSASGTLTVSQAPLTITAASANKTYGDGNPTFTGTIVGLKNNDAISAFYTSAATAATAAGTYGPTSANAIVPAPVDSTPSTLGNYTVTLLPGTLTVDKAPLSITATNASKTYGEANPTLTGSIVGLKNHDGITASYSTAADASSPVGSYSIVPAAVDSSPSTLDNYSVTLVNGTLTIGKAALTVTTNAASKVYGQDNPAFSVSYSGFVNGDDASMLGGTLAFATTAMTGSDVGSYDVTPSGLTSSNYTISFVKGTLTITPAPMLVTTDPQTKVYGQANPQLTGSITGLKNTDTITASYSTLADATSAVGVYSITATLNDPSGKLGNYSVTNNGTNLTITKAPLAVTADSFSRQYGQANPTFTGTITGIQNHDAITASYSTAAVAASPVGTYDIVPSLSGAALSNYQTPVLTNGTLTVTTAPLTITAASASRTYGDANPSFTGTITGIQNGDAISATYSTTATAGTPAGAYAVVPAAVDSSPSTLGNYTVTTHNGTLTIGKAALTVTTNAASKVYGQDNPAFTVSYAGFVNGDTAASLGGTLSFATTASASSHVGSYGVTPSDLTSSNYSITFRDGTLTVTPAPLTIKADDKAMTYGGTQPALTWTANFVNGDTAASLSTAPTLATEAASSHAGSYAITASGAADPDYAITYQQGTLTITPALLTITADNKSKVYGAATPALTASYTGLVNGDTPAVFAAGTNVTPTLSTVPATSHAGSYAITITGASNPDYTITQVPGTFVIGKAPLTITADDKSKVYGTANPALTATYTGLVNGDTPAALSTAPTLSTVASTASHVGSYAITASGAVDPDYTISYTDGTLTVTPASLTITALDQGTIYGTTAVDLTTNASTLRYTGFVNGDDASKLATAAVLHSTGTATSHTGSYPISVDGATSGDYTIVFQGATLTIAPAPLTITADDKSMTYGGTLPALTATYTGLVNGDTPGTFGASPNVTPTLTTADASSHAGSYTITIAGAVNADYTIVQVNGTLTINRAALRISADNKSMTYGGEQPALTASYTGLVNGDTPATFGASPNVTPTLSTVLASSHAGSYTITITSASNPDYTITQVNGTLMVTPAALRIMADDKAMTYGGTRPVLTVTYTGLVNGDTAATFSTSPNTAPVVSTVPATSHAGSYAITASGAVNPDYTISYQTGTLTISQAVLTITAGNKAMTYGGTRPVLTASYTGLVNGDTPGTFGASPNVTPTLTTADATSHAGSYTITITGASNPDYTITQVPGTFVIGKAPLTITADDKSKVYGAANPALTASYTGLVNGDTPAVFAAGTNVTPTLSTVAASSHVGSYVITLAGARDPDYTITLVNGTLTVTPAPLTITANDKTMTYLGTMPALTATYTGLVNGDTPAVFGASPNVTATLATAATASSPVGSYAITPSGAVDPDYAITYVQGTLKIVYRFDGFLQPINDTGHTQTCGSPCSQSVFKANSTVPVKFVLKDANGNVLVPGANATMPRWLTPGDLGTATNPVDESTYTDTPTPGTYFTWDGSQYKFNWKTSSTLAGHVWKIGALLDDGEMVTVTIGLR